MPRNFRLDSLRAKLDFSRDPRTVVRLILGGLLLANIAAALFVFRPWGGGSQDLESQAADLQRQILRRQANIKRTQSLVAKTSAARLQGDQFIAQNFLGYQNTYSTIVTELLQDYDKAHIVQKDQSFARDPVEGSDTLDLLTIQARLEGKYNDLLTLLNELDRSPRFLTIEYLQAAPQQNGKMLDIVIRVNAYVRSNSAGAGL